MRAVILGSLALALLVLMGCLAKPLRQPRLPQPILTKEEAINLTQTCIRSVGITRNPALDYKWDARFIKETRQWRVTAVPNISRYKQSLEEWKVYRARYYFEPPPDPLPIVTYIIDDRKGVVVDCR